MLILNMNGERWKTCFSYIKIRLLENVQLFTGPGWLNELGSWIT